VNEVKEEAKSEEKLQQKMVKGSGVLEPFLNRKTKQLTFDEIPRKIKFERFAYFLFSTVA
jgi:hypothetical protein